MKFNIVVSATVMITSTGGASRHMGGVLGQFEYLEDKGYYVQTSTEQSDEKFTATYLYPDEDDEWWVSSTPGVRAGVLWNPSHNKTPAPPSSGWRYVDGLSWISDDTLSVTPGTLPPLPRHFLVTVSGAAAEKLPSYRGLFSRTERWWMGRPVYENTVGMFLYHTARNWGWVIGNTLHGSALRGSRARISPSYEDSWTFWAGSEWKPASVIVTSSDKI